MLIKLHIGQVLWANKVGYLELGELLPSRLARRDSTRRSHSNNPQLSGTLMGYRCTACGTNQVHPLPAHAQCSQPYHQHSRISKEKQPACVHMCHPWVHSQAGGTLQRHTTPGRTKKGIREAAQPSANHLTQNHFIQCRFWNQRSA